MSFNPESQHIPQRDWMQVTCPKCEGKCYVMEETFHLEDGSIEEEEMRCEDCTDGKVWQEIWV
jgi:hypothetical protein